MAKKKKVKAPSPRKIRKEEKKAIKAEDKRYEALRIKQNKEALKTGNAVPYGQQDKSDWRHSTNPQATYIRTDRPEQQQIKEDMRPRLQSSYDALRMPGAESTFAPIEQGYRERFANQTVPGLAQRFQHATGGAGYSSPAFTKQLASQQGDLETELADLRARHGLAERGEENNNYWKALSAYQSPDIDTAFTPGEDSLLRKGTKFAINALGNYAGSQGGNLAQQGFNALSSVVQNRRQNNQQQQGNPYIDPASKMNDNSGFSGSNVRGFNSSGMSTRKLAGAGYEDLNPYR